MSFLHVAKGVLLNLFSWILVFLAFIPVSIGFAFFAAWKWISNRIVLTFHPDWIPLSALDLACSVFFNPLYQAETYNNVGFAIVLDEELTIEEARTHFATHLLNQRSSSVRSVAPGFEFERLRQQPVKSWGNYYWAPIPEAKLDLTKLVWEREKAETTDFRQFLSEWLKRGFNPNGPLWEVALYKDGDEYDKKCIFLFKMSHVLGDGITIQKLAQATSVRLEENNNHSRRMNQSASDSSNSPISVPIVPQKLRRFSFSTPRLMLSQIANIFAHSDFLTRTPRSNEMVITFASVDVAPVRSLAHAHKCKFGDVLLSLWVNALRRLLLDLNVEEQALPRYLPIVSPRVITGRITPMVNGITLGILNVEMRNCDRGAKLRHLVAKSRKIFDAGCYDVMERLMSLAYYLPLCFLLPTENVKPGVTCAVSSFPVLNFFGPGRRIFGKFSASRLFMLQQLFDKNFGFTTTFVTTRENKIDVTIVGNKGIVKSQETMDKFGEYLREELNLMSELCKADEGSFKSGEIV